ncbi:MAG: ABC transporter substrate-binding protein [Dehalococcoidia bacterium]
MNMKALSLRRMPLLVALSGLLISLAVACGSAEATPTTADPSGEPTSTADPGGPSETATATPSSGSDLPQPENELGVITMVDVTLTGSPGSLPDLPMFPARQFGIGESLFAPEGDDWDAPMLAESWELEDDLSSVTITIREGVQFHGDWGEMTAEDMAWVINRTNPSINPESIAASAANFSALFGDTPVEALDDYTIRAHFDNFDVRWASNLLNQEATGGLTSIATSKRAFDEMGAEWMRANFIGTGPFQVVSHIEDLEGTYEAVPYDHWRKDAEITQFKMLAVPEEASRMAMLQTGDADVAFIDPKNHAQVIDAGYLPVSAGQGIQQGVFFPGNLWEETNALTGEPLEYGTYVNSIPWIGNPFDPGFGEPPDGMDSMERARLVRTALAMSVDRDAIIEHVMGGIGTPVHVEYFSTQNPNWDPQYEYPFDEEGAEALLDEAGYPRGSGDIRFEIPLFIGPELGGGEGPAGEIGDAIGGFWDNLGVRTQVLKYAYAVYRPGLVGRTSVTPLLTSCDDGKESYPWDWPKGLVMTTLTRGGFACGNESPEILEWYRAAASEPDVQARIDINNELLEYMHHWAIAPGYVSVPQAYFANPNSISEWPMHLGNSFNSPQNIVSARQNTNWPVTRPSRQLMAPSDWRHELPSSLGIGSAPEG